MPYKIIGSKIMHKKGNKWAVKQVCESPTNAKKALSLLIGLEKGTTKNAVKSVTKKKDVSKSTAGTKNVGKKAVSKKIVAKKINKKK
jgi:hypothetical protein